MKIGIILGSIREGRTGAAVADWVYDVASQRDDAKFEIVDLKDFDVPLLTSATVPAAANKVYDSPEVTRWSQAIDACDGYIVVTPEYNHGVPGALKNAVDSLGPEWFGKTVAFVSYGADAGVRAVEQWRQIVANFHMNDIRSQVALSLFTDFGAEGLALQERRAAELVKLLDDLVTATAHPAD
ncbi:NADPH-dependent FMN reductase [Skermania piniformis]|uniref:NAD(P)H-dependent oxidoreductase n=1 Tax=Skermania pinensis TaxID=39122 RepID=A0ABX8SF43_9ACTN|nr:NAD(P)H-dependent oxidoreductase [Skermania piniformis]QXQ15045.1 NAD(P)H-dependent oxidoreductase [Skermania piniformis]